MLRPTRILRRALTLGVCALTCAACASSTSSKTVTHQGKQTVSPYPATPPDAPPIIGKGVVLIRGATILTGTPHKLAKGYILLREGRIAELGDGAGPNLVASPDVVIIDATDKFVTPGLIDTHSHLGV